MREKNDNKQTNKDIIDPNWVALLATILLTIVCWLLFAWLISSVVTFIG